MKNKPVLFIILSCLVIGSFLINMVLGSVSIPIGYSIKSVCCALEVVPEWEVILWQFRMPKALTAAATGIALSVSGLLMQTFFRNPLAGPYVLGLSSGSSLGVALFVLSGSALGYTYSITSWGLVSSAAIGCIFVFFLITLLVPRIQSSLTLLIIGLMFGSLAGALVGILSFWANAENLQQDVFWGLGNLSALSYPELTILYGCLLLGLLLAFFCSKWLNALLLGEEYAKSLGIPHKKVQYIVIIATCVLTGSVTAFVGPIAFVGLAVPYFSRMLFSSTDHKLHLLACMLLGSAMMLWCDTLSHIIATPRIIPINAITSLLGAPIVIFLLVAKRRFYSF